MNTISEINNTIDSATGTEVVLNRDIEKMENKNETHR